VRGALRRDGHHPNPRVLGRAPVPAGTAEPPAALVLPPGGRRHDVGRITASAVAALDGRPVIVTDGEDDTLVIRDLDTGSQLGAPLGGHEAAPTQLGVADLGGRPVLVSAARDNTIRVWDLAVRGGRSTAAGQCPPAALARCQEALISRSASARPTQVAPSTLLPGSSAL
jgi:hypothetical protein